VEVIKTGGSDPVDPTDRQEWTIWVILGLILLMLAILLALVIFYRGARTDAIYEIPDSAALEAELVLAAEHVAVSPLYGVPTADHMAVSPVYGIKPRDSMWSRSSLPKWSMAGELSHPDAEPGLGDEDELEHHYEEQWTPDPSPEDDMSSMYASPSFDATQFVDWGMEN